MTDKERITSLKETLLREINSAIDGLLQATNDVLSDCYEITLIDFTTTEGFINDARETIAKISDTGG